MLFVRLRQRRWAVTVFITCSLAIFLWTSDSAKNVPSAPKSDSIGADIRVDDDQTHDIQSIYSDDQTKVKAGLSQLTVDLITNKSHSPLRVGGNGTWRGNSKVPPFRWCYDDEAVDRKLGDQVGCGELFEGEIDANNETYPETVRRGKRWRAPCEYTDQQIVQLASTDCSQFLRKFNFLNDTVGVPVSEEELNFPLAYVMVVEKWASQVVRLLSAVYRRHNLYCLTYDQHAKSHFKQAMKATARCLQSNVLMPDEHFEIYWADISLLNATLQCMRMLSNSGNQWKYVQILSYNDFPLRTNKEMVHILRQFEGANDVELTKSQTERYAHYYKFAELDEEASRNARPLPPAGLVIYKGSYAATLSRDFVRYVFDNKDAQQFLQWSVPTWAPEEQFWSTLIHNDHLNAPGTFPGRCLDYYRYGYLQKLWISRFQLWYTGCHGRYKSGSCIFGVGDLSLLIRRPELIAHKFYSDYQPATLYCLARRHYERTYMEEENWEYEKIELNDNYYANLPAVRYQRMTQKDQFNCGIVFKKVQAPV